MKIGFIGSGAMGEALVKGLIDSGRYSPEDICCSDILETRCEFLSTTYGVSAHRDNIKVVESSDIIILAVKPDKVREVVLEVKGIIDKTKLLVSIAAGVSTNAIETWLDKDVPVIRVVPNTPCVIGKGISAIAPGKYSTELHQEKAQDIFACVGDTVKVSESLMDAVTGVSGSGPAYVYLVIEAMIDAAVTVGLPRTAAADLVLKTVIGSAEMVLQTGQHPAVLKAQVVSPGGTTAAGLNELESGKLRALFTGAVKAAVQRAGELGE